MKLDWKDCEQRLICVYLKVEVDVKVYIGNYIRTLNVYEISDFLSFFCIHKRDRDWIGDRLENTWVTDLCVWWNNRRKRAVYIKIDDYDYWDAQDTIAMVALPILKKLRLHKHGAPFIEDCDVPEELKSTNSTITEHGIDGNHFARFDWVLDEMIYALDCIADSSWEDQYWDDNYTFDREGHAEHEKRIKNGLRLFGTYFRGLWD